MLMRASSRQSIWLTAPRWAAGERKAFEPRGERMPVMDGSGNSRLVFAGVHESASKPGSVKDLSRVREPVSRSKSGVQGKVADVLHGRSRHTESWLRRRGPTRGRSNHSSWSITATGKSTATRRTY